MRKGKDSSSSIEWNRSGSGGVRKGKDSSSSIEWNRSGSEKG